MYWTAELTFDHDLPFESIGGSAKNWPWDHAAAADLPEPAQRITRSLEPTVVLPTAVVD